MTEITHEALDESAAEAEVVAPPKTVPLLERTLPLFGIFLAVGLIVFVAAFLTVHHRPGEQMAAHSGSQRSFNVISHWITEGYFHYSGQMVVSPPGAPLIVYKTSTGVYMVSGFLLERLYIAMTGHYSWRLLAVHNQIVTLLAAALFGLLTYRVARRFDLDARLSFAAGAAVVIVIFTFPDNLYMYWEMSSQTMWTLFAALFLVLEERCLDGRRTLPLSIAQALTVLVMTLMDKISGLAFVSAMAVTLLVLEQQRGAWKRYLLIALMPALLGLGIYGLQVQTRAARMPDANAVGSGFMVRSGLDGEARYYGDHLDIAKRRDTARANWPANREYLFQWKTLFILGVISVLVLVAAFVAGRTPRIAVDALAWHIGTWLLYGAVFSQSFVIHPYLYDIILFVPLAIALFGYLPALAESFTRRTGAILMLTLFSAFWFSLYQMRLYALWYPLPKPAVAAPASH
jgi:hypothetical protein